MANKLPSDYRLLEYVEHPSSGTVYINTKLNTTQNYRLYMDFYLPSSLSTANYVTIFGGRDQQGSSLRSFSFWCLGDGTGFRSDYGGATVNIVMATNRGHFTVDKNKTNVTVTNVGTGEVETATNKTATFTTNSYLYLMNLNSLNTTDSRAPFGMRLYTCQIYDNGTMVRDYVPAKRKSDNVVGLYDLQNSVFYTPTGGSLIAGPEIIVLNMNCKIDGNWKSIDSGYLKVGNEWKELSAQYIKNNNWKQ